MHLPHELTFAETITTSNDHSKVSSFIFLAWTLPSNSTKYFTLLFVRSETLDRPGLDRVNTKVWY